MVGVTRAAAAALGFRSLLADLGLDWPVRVWTDSTASIGMCSRQGLGKVRHLDVQLMWIQQRIRNHDLDLYKVLGEENPADLMTKAGIPQDRANHLIKLMGCSFAGGRPATAPELRREGGTKAFLVDGSTKPRYSLSYCQGISRAGMPSATPSSSPCVSHAPVVAELHGRCPYAPKVPAACVCCPEGPGRVAAEAATGRWKDENGVVMDQEYLQDFALRVLGLPHSVWRDIAMQKVVPPDAPAEVAEPVDPFIEEGLALGEQGRGRAVLPARFRDADTGRGGAQNDYCAPALNCLLGSSEPCSCFACCAQPHVSEVSSAQA